MLCGFGTNSRDREFEVEFVGRRYSSPDTGLGTALFDTCNTFGKLNCYLMLWNMVYLWNCESRFADNQYWHWGKYLIQDDHRKPALVIKYKEGITQGDCFSMSLYVAALLPPVARMRGSILKVIQPWYVDDAGAAKEAMANASCIRYLVSYGPRYGYFVEPTKSHYI